VAAALGAILTEIIFGSTEGLRRVSAAGGQSEEWTVPDATRGEASHGGSGGWLSPATSKVAWKNGFVPRLTSGVMMEYPMDYYRSRREGRWVIETRFRQAPWKVIVEPDPDRKVLVIVTVYPTDETE